MIFQSTLTQILILPTFKMKNLKKVLIWLILPLFLVLITSKLLKSNTKYIKINDCLNSGQIMTLKNLDDLVSQNFFNRTYYEVISYSNGPCCLANYNKELQLLSIGTDGMSGFYGRYKASPAQLHEIVNKNVKFDSLKNYLQIFEIQENQRIDIPTRSGNLISFY